jgi:hypothetical protein
MMVGTMTMAGATKQISAKLILKNRKMFQKRNKTRSKSIKLPQKLMTKRTRKIYTSLRMMTSKKKTNSTKFCQKAKKTVDF